MVKLDANFNNKSSIGLSSKQESTGSTGSTGSNSGNGENADPSKTKESFMLSETKTGNKIDIYKNLTEIQGKLAGYLNTVIIIIIFLIFLNLFITTYFYFTTSIQATANRSNCGGASLCEAETHRHLFLEDNGNDKARDIYIIIVVIFSIYLLSEIFKSYKDGIKNDNDDNNIIIIVPIVVLFLYFAFIVGTIIGIIENADLKGKPAEINVVSSALFMFYLFVIGCILYFTGGVEKALASNFTENTFTEKIIKILTVLVPLAIIGVEIVVLAGGSKNDLFKGFKGDNFNLINSKFKAHTALHIIFIVFYIIFFVTVLVLSFYNNIEALYIWGLVFLAFILFTLFTFILLASLDFKNTDYFWYLNNITGSTLGMQYFVLLAPLFIFVKLQNNIPPNAIKLIVLYYSILFIIYLFYVYFVNHSNETGILPLESFQLYNWISEEKKEKEKNENGRLNHKKNLNIANVYFVVILLLILLGIGSSNEDPNLDNIIYGIIVFILASYITGIVYFLYNLLFPIQQSSFNYKKNLVDINNEISQHIKAETVEHSIDKNKIRVFKIANDANELKDIHKRIDSERKDGTTSKEKRMKNIRDIFREISPKGSSYEDYRSQSTDQMQYEEYIYRLFSGVEASNMSEFQESFDNTIFHPVITTNQHKVYNDIITKLPKNKDELGNLELTDTDKNELLNKTDLFKIPVTNNIEYVIKKNYKYVTGEEGVIQKYNSDRKMTQENKNALYWIKLKNSGNNKKGFHYHNTYYGANNVDSDYIPHTDDNWYKVDDNPGDSDREFFSAFRYDKIFSVHEVNKYKNLNALDDTFFTDGNINTNLFNREDLKDLSSNQIKQELKKIEEKPDLVKDITVSMLQKSKTGRESKKVKNETKVTNGINNNKTLLALIRFYLNLETNQDYYKVNPTKPSPGDHDNDDEIRNMLFNPLESEIFEKISLLPEDRDKIGVLDDMLYKMKISEFNKIKEKVKDKDRVYFMVFEDKGTNLINCYVSYNITNPESSIKISSEDDSDFNTIKNTKTESTPSITELQAYIDKIDPVLAPFYTIGYDYENYTEDHQQMKKNTVYSIPARYYACSYLNYFPNEDGSMSKVKFAKNINEDNYNPLNIKKTITDRIAEKYDKNAKETKIELAPEKFQFLLVFLVILAIILLVFLFNIIKKYFTGDVYTPQMYVLGILGVFLTIFIFGEVIFARIK